MQEFFNSQYEVLEIPVLKQPKIYLILRGELRPSNLNVADFLCMHEATYPCVGITYRPKTENRFLKSPPQSEHILRHIMLI